MCSVPVTKFAALGLTNSLCVMAERCMTGWKDRGRAGIMFPRKNKALAPFKGGGAIAGAQGGGFSGGKLCA